MTILFAFFLSLYLSLFIFIFSLNFNGANYIIIYIYYYFYFFIFLVIIFYFIILDISYLLLLSSSSSFFFVWCFFFFAHILIMQELAKSTKGARPTEQNKKHQKLVLTGWQVLLIIQTICCLQQTRILAQRHFGMIFCKTKRKSVRVVWAVVRH